MIGARNLRGCPRSRDIGSLNRLYRCFETAMQKEDKLTYNQHRKSHKPAKSRCRSRMSWRSRFVRRQCLSHILQMHSHRLNLVELVQRMRNCGRGRVFVRHRTFRPGCQCRRWNSLIVVLLLIRLLGCYHRSIPRPTKKEEGISMLFY